jgi:3-oxoacyl-[acyl-carrier protein] reductase
MAESLKGQVALITGGGSGIGRGIALALAAQGVKVAVCGRQADKLAQTVASLVEQDGGSGLAITGDVSLEDDARQIIESVVKHFGKLDILVNNAGVGGGGQVHELDPKEWDYVLAVNLRGPFLMTRFALPYMRDKRSGHIINISSESGLEYYPEDAAYGTSKHALNAFGEFVQRENQDLNIRVNTICPGMVVTPMSEDSPGLQHEKCLYPEDIADLVVWLLTRRSNIKIGLPVLIQTMLNPWE